MKDGILWGGYMEWRAVLVMESQFFSFLLIIFK